MEELKGLKKVDGRVNNGLKPGENRGQGRKHSVAKLKEEAYKIGEARFWADAAESIAAPFVMKIVDGFDENGTPVPMEVRLRAAQEILNRALGKPKERQEVSGELSVRWEDQTV